MKKNNKTKGNKTAVAIQLALAFVDAHREQFEKWLRDNSLKEEKKDF